MPTELVGALRYYVGKNSSSPGSFVAKLNQQLTPSSVADVLAFTSLHISWTRSLHQHDQDLKKYTLASRKT